MLVCECVYLSSIDWVSLCTVKEKNLVLLVVNNTQPKKVFTDFVKITIDLFTFT